MDRTEETRDVTIERGTVREKRIPEGGFWWQYKVESITRDGLKSLWMEAAVFWEHMTMPETGGTANKGFDVGTNVYYFMFGDGRGVILDRIVNTAADYTSKMKLWVDFMNTVKEQHQTIINMLSGIGEYLSGMQTNLYTKIDNTKSALSGEISGAKTSIEGKVGDAQSALSGEISGAQSAIEGKIGDVQTAVAGDVSGAQSAIESAIGSAKGELNGQLTAIYDIVSQL